MLDHNSDNLVDDIIAHLEDPERFFSLLSIVDKTGAIVPFVLNEEQKVLLRLWKNSPESRKRLLVLKPRQIGSSTFFTALLFYIWYTSPDPIKICSMAHTSETSKNFMAMFKNYWDNLDPMLRESRALSVSNTTTMTLEDTGATLLIKTAGAKGGARSFSFNILHMSELAFYPQVEELMATAIPALNDGDLFIESTPNHWQDGLHTRILQAEQGIGNWNYQFFKWSEHSEYNRVSAQPIILTDYEQTLADLYDLTPEQLLWRREKVVEIGEHKFRRDYPLEISDAYSLGENTWLTDAELGHLVSSNLDTLNPIKGEQYAIGVDVALGIGKDYSVIFVVNVKTSAPVYVWASNSISPTDLATHIVSIASTYNNAKVLVEVNNHGLATLNELNHLNYTNLFKTESGDHFMTTAKSKPLILENLRRTLSKQIIKYLDDKTITQLRALQVKGNQIILPTSNQGHSDSVMALAMALWCRDSIYIPSPRAQPNFFDEIAKRSVARINSQHARY